jgi:hypothetical protein
VEQLRPRRQAGPPDDPQELRPQVGVRVPAATDNVDRPLLGPLETLLQMGTQFREDRDPALPAAGVVLGFRAADQEAAPVPVDIGPLQLQVLAGTAEPAEPGEGEQKPPFVVRTGSRHFLGHFSCDEELPGPVSLERRLHVIERIARDKPAADCGTEELFRPLHHDRHRAVGVALPEPEEPGIGIARGNVLEGPVLVEELDQPAWQAARLIRVRGLMSVRRSM